MRTHSPIHRFPLLRVLAPFVAGILLHQWWHTWLVPITILIAAIGVYLLLNARGGSPQQVLLRRPYYVIPLSMAAIALGWLAAVIHCPPQLSDSQLRGQVLTGRVVQLEYTDFSMRMDIDLLNSDLPPCRVLVSTRGCDYTLRAGDLVAWQGDLHEAGNLGNPDEMDYARYLLDSKGIRYEQHLPVGRVLKVGHSPTLATRMAEVRRQLQDKVFNSQLSPVAGQFVVAMLLGNGDLIDKSTRQAFSAAGVAHVLALSGLHVGFIALIIWWLLFPLDYVGMRKTRLLITLGAIVLFAVFTGLSSSVVRAAVMTGFVFASLIFYRRSISLNALAAAALAILVFTPSALYSVGFQLSFITVGAVLLFGDVPDRLKSRHQWVNAVTSTAITSLVAMLATVGLTAHYFHTVSLLSVLSNLLILPVLPVFMVAGALFLLVTAAGLHWGVLNWVLDGICGYINWAVRAVNALPFSHISGVWVTTAGAVVYFVVLALVALWIYRRRKVYLLAAGCCLVVLLAHSVWVDARTPRQGMVIFNSFSSTPLLYYDNGTGYVWTPDEEETDAAAFSRYHAGFLAHHRIDSLHFIAEGDTLRLEGAMFKPPYAYVMGRRLMAVGKGHWRQATSGQVLELDDIIVTKRFHGTAGKLRELYRFERLIVSGACHDVPQLVHEGDSLQLRVHALSRDGGIAWPQ